MNEFFARVEATLLAQFNEAQVVQHAGDRGENLETILSDVLRKRLPHRYGVVKGQVITSAGEASHSADLIIYDAIDCPVLYTEQTAVVPVEGVYGIVELKSRLSKGELVDAMQKIASFKRLAPRGLSVIRTREYVTVHRSSRPFGIVFGYSLADNSLGSLRDNVSEEHARIHEVNYFTNLVCVLGEGLLAYEKADVDAGQKSLLLDTDEFVELVLTEQKRERNNEPPLNVFTRVVVEGVGDRTFGRFFVLLLSMLARLKLSVPDLGRYLDQDLPIQIVRES
jgi:hypothetical protein